MKKFFRDFKAFISRGNVMDLAVGMIIGTAFTAIVTALSNGFKAAYRLAARYVAGERNLLPNSSRFWWKGRMRTALSISQTPST